MALIIMDIYTHQLRSACETWFKSNYTGLYHTAFRSQSNPVPFLKAGYMNEELPEIELTVSIGPWKSIHVWFKSPEVVLSGDEKETMNQMRSQGYRVAIVRHVEDFKTLMCTLIYPI